MKTTTGGVISQSFRADCNLEAGFSGLGAEGTALLEIVHDVAPGAQLYFANFDGFSLTFEQAVNWLAANTDIVVDDISFVSPPYDGTSSVSVNTTAALANGSNPIRSYITSAGNQALNHWQEPFTSTGIDASAVLGGPAQGEMQIFEATANTADRAGFGSATVFNAVMVPNGGTADIWLTWNDTWGASTNNYDMAVLRVTGPTTLVGSSTTAQVGGQDPKERVVFTNNTGATAQYDIIVWNKNNTANIRNLEMFVFGDFVDPSVPLAWQTSRGSLLAQADARGEVISVGAVDQLNPTVIEGFSSQGPTEDARMKPDVVATDGVSVTGFGGFLPSGVKFFGTSASAPHVAGLAALLMDAHPRLQHGQPNALAAATARTLLRGMITGSASDLGDAGADNVFGAGRIDGVTAGQTTGPAAATSFASGPANGTTGVLGGAVTNGLFYLQPVIRIQDALGNNVTTATNSVTISIKPLTGTAGATLLGTTTRAAVNGVATFTDLKIDRPGTGYVLVATSTGLATAEGAAFDVTLGTTGQTFGVVTAGVAHSCLTTSTGAAFCWGDATYGELGNGTIAPDLPNPAQSYADTHAAGVVGLTSGVQSIVAGGSFTCAITSTNGAKCWGSNQGTAGSLGRALAPDGDPLPGDVTGLTSGVAQISAGGTFACAVTTTGAAKCWGMGLYGQMGKGTNVQDNPVATNVTGLGSGIASVSAGTDFACALTTTGGVKCWGANEFGAIGDSTFAAGLNGSDPFFTNVPRDVTGLGSGVSMISAGGAHACALLTGGTVRCWGSNHKGQLGDGSTTNTNQPAIAVPGLTGVTSIAAAGHSTCALLSTNAVRCWGSNEFGQLGNGSAVAHSVTPVDVTGLASNVTSLEAGFYHACAVQTGIVKCWGRNQLGQLGTGNLTSSNVPAVLSTVAPTILVTTQPSGATAGANLTTQPVFRITDADGNTVTTSSAQVTVAIKSGTGGAGAVLAGTTSVNAVNGVATFTDLRIDKAAAGYVLTASATGFTSADTNSFTVAFGSATTLAFGTPPAGAVTGAFGGAVPNAVFTTQPTVQVRDSFGNVITNSSASITVAIKGGTGTLGASLLGTTTVAAVNGIATFTNLRIDRPGTGYVLTASSAPLADGDSAPFNVTQGSATKLVVTTQPQATTGGVTFGSAVQVAIADGDGNTVTSRTDAVTLVIKSGTGTLGATLSGTRTVNALAGVATFPGLTIDRSGTGYVLTGTASGLTSIDSDAFNVTVGPATRLEFGTLPAGAVTGAFGGAVPNAIFTQQPTVRATDAGGNTVTGYPTNIVVAIKGGTGTLGASLLGTLSVAPVNGVATFTNLRIDRPGTGYVLTATSAALTAADSTAFTVTQGPVTTLDIQTQPGNGTAGSALTTQPVIHLLDGDGNLVTGATNAVTAVITGGTGRFGGVLSGTTTVNAVGGIATFSDLRIDLAATNYTITFLVNGVPAATSNAITVVSAAASRLAFASHPSGGIAGAALRTQASVRITDAWGNTVNSTATVALTIKPATGTSGAVLDGTTSLPATAGESSFTNVAINLAGSSYVLVASSGSLVAAESTAFTVGTSALRVLTAPSGFTGGTSFTTQPVFRVEDGVGVVAGATGTVTVAIKAGTGTSGATLSGTTMAALSSGVATFTNLKIDTAGRDYILVASVTGHASVESAPFDVLYGTPVALNFELAPVGNVPGNMLAVQPIVTLVDAGGNTVLTATNTITLAIAPPTTAVLGGTKVIAAVNGRVTYFDLAIDLGGTYMLRATAGGFSNLDSTAFNMAAPVSGGGGGGGGGGGALTLTVEVGGPLVPTLSLIGGDVPKSGPDLTLTSPTVVGQTGGSGTVILVVSSRALPGADQVAIQPVADIAKLLEQAPLPAGSGTVLSAVFLATLNASNQPIITPFVEAVQLSMTIPAGSVPNGAGANDFTIAYWDKDQWVMLESKGVLDERGNLTVTAAVKHFTPFAVIHGKVGTGAPPVVAGAGRFVSPPIFGTGSLGLAVFGGGTVDQLEAAAVDVNGRGVWVQDAKGAFHLLIVKGPAFLRSEFVGFFPQGFPTTLAVTVTR